jgi:hypothetical protein
MTIWAIVAVYQGDLHDLEVTADEEQAQTRYQELVRQAVHMPYSPWEKVLSQYEQDLDACRKIDKIYLEEVEVKDIPTDVIFKVVEREVMEAAYEQGVLLHSGELEELCSQVGDSLDNHVPSIVADIVGDYIYEKENK